MGKYTAATRALYLEEGLVEPADEDNNFGREGPNIEEESNDELPRRIDEV